MCIFIHAVAEAASAGCQGVPGATTGGLLPCQSVPLSCTSDARPFPVPTCTLGALALRDSLQPLHTGKATPPGHPGLYCVTNSETCKLAHSPTIGPDLLVAPGIMVKTRDKVSGQLLKGK